jgi:hypothetical protein
LEFCSITLSGESDQVLAEAPERLAHQFKIFRRRQEPPADHFKYVVGIIGRPRLLPLQLAAFVVTREAKRPHEIAVLAADHMIVLFALSQVAAASETDLVVDA